MHFDVVIPVAYKDISIISTTIKYIRKYLIEAEKIFILTKRSNFKKLQRKISNNCILIDEDQLIEDLTYSKVKSYIEMIDNNFVNRTGWYFQQFLKYAFAISKYCTNDYYLSWDADTIPLNSISFFSGDHPMFTLKREYHEAYFNTMKRLLHFEKVIDNSFIAEHMLFKKDIVENLLNDISKSTINGENWVQKILNACDFVNDKYNLFSEFETYGTYCTIKYSNLYETRKLSTFRGAGIIRGQHLNKHIIDVLAIDLDTASFEVAHAMFPWNINYIINKLWKKIKFYIC